MAQKGFKRPQRLPAGQGAAQKLEGADRTTYLLLRELNKEAAQGASLNYRLIDKTRSPYTPVADDVVIEARTGPGSVTVNLPRAKSNPRRPLVVKKLNSGNNLVIRAETGETVGAGSSVTITADGAFRWLVSDGISSWRIIASNSI